MSDEEDFIKAKGAIEQVIQSMKDRGEEVPKNLESAPQAIEDAKKQELEATQQSADQAEVLAAQQKLGAVRRELESLIAVTHDPKIKGELDTALKSVSSITISSANDARLTSTTVSNAEKTAAVGETVALAEAVTAPVGLAVGLTAGMVGMASLLNNKTMEVFESFGAALGVGKQGHEIKGSSREDLAEANLIAATNNITGEAYARTTNSGVSMTIKQIGQDTVLSA